MRKNSNFRAENDKNIAKNRRSAVPTVSIARIRRSDAVPHVSTCPHRLFVFFESKINVGIRMFLQIACCFRFVDVLLGALDGLV